MKFVNMFLAFVFFVGIFFSDISITSYTLSPDPIIPGATGTLNLDIQNTGSLTATVQIDTTSIKPIISDARVNVGDLEPSGAVKLALPFKVEQNAETGVYTIRLTVYGSTKAGVSASTTSNQLKTIILPVKVLNKPLVSVKSPRITLLKESDTTVPLELFNTGGKAVNMKLYVSSNNFLQVGNSPLLIGELSNVSYHNLTVFVTDSVQAGTNVLPLVMSYQDLLGNSYNDTVNLPVDVKEKKTSFVVQALTSNAIIGTNNEVMFSLTNNGDSTAYNVKFKVLSDNDITTLGASTIDLGDIEKSKTVTVPVMLAVSQIEEGYKTINVEVQYEDKNRNRATESTHAGIRLSGKPEVSLYIDSKPVPLTQGKEHTLSVIVSNGGNSKLRGLEVTLEPDNNILLLDSAKSQFIGSLSEDDFSSVQYRIIPKKSVELTTLQVKLKYQDVFNNIREESRNISLRVVSPNYLSEFSEKNTNGNLLIVGVAVAAIIVWYFYFRKKK